MASIVKHSFPKDSHDFTSVVATLGEHVDSGVVAAKKAFSFYTMTRNIMYDVRVFLKQQIKRKKRLPW